MKNPFKNRAREDVTLKVGPDVETGPATAKQETTSILEVRKNSNAPKSVATTDSTTKPPDIICAQPENSTIPDGLTPRKRRLGLVLTSLFLAACPILIAAGSCVFDPAALPYFKATFFDSTRAERLADYTKSYDLNHDQRTLYMRSRFYADDENDKRIAELRAIIRSGTKNHEVLQSLAEILATKPGNREEIVNLYKKSIEMTLDRPAYWIFDDSNLSYSLYDDNFALLNLGEYKYVEAFCRVNRDNRHFADDRFRLLQGLALREIDNSGEYKRLLLRAAGEKPLVPRQINADANYFLALDELNLLNTEQAKQYWARGASAKKYAQDPWLRDLTAGWIAYSQGHYIEALKKIEKLDSKYTPAQSAEYWLRSRILLKLKRLPEAQTIIDNYREISSLGFDDSIYIPKRFRPEK